MSRIFSWFFIFPKGAKNRKISTREKVCFRLFIKLRILRPGLFAIFFCKYNFADDQTSYPGPFFRQEVKNGPEYEVADDPVLNFLRDKLSQIFVDFGQNTENIFLLGWAP